MNVDRVAVLVAVAAVIVSVIYGRRQAGIAREAKDEARRSADAAEQQVTIAEAAKDEARRAADAAAEVARIEVRRDHLAGATKDVELLRVESRRHPTMPFRQLVALFRNNGQRTYDYAIDVEYQGGGVSTLRIDKVHAGETVPVFLGQAGIGYARLIGRFDGECSCGQPDGESHWRQVWRVPEPATLEDEPPSIH
ncbi:hypothetical protein V6U81_25040 [Micromonospora sp. CPCC 205711]|uniref:hypothetical protein n=1 Tax=Micromonospora sp. CPCC 205547 TaxID=3122400 RepID=UPI002FF0BEF9